ncbi:hypothetical protein AJ80_01775 [Polytolypa hystricis UAMH7299]|uniref:ribonuclease Z n=1 Tax=Polytolypa hystricis (strain UAMH7299) TaxID=1447883 RepID=A0A2B7Z065_POLH7|nr:hypothetical protein AJ80_01775 [Polytolypa hystricis UAMH7299]
MKAYFQFITTPTADTPGTTLLLHFDQKRYIFGHVAEGTQRACAQQGIRPTHISDIFLTGVTSWANTGGLLGMMLTLAESTAFAASTLEIVRREKIANMEKKLLEKGPAEDKGILEDRIQDALEKLDGGKKAAPVPKVGEEGALCLYGAPNIAHTVATARRFIFRKGMPVYVSEFDGSEERQRQQRQQGGEGKKKEEGELEIDPSWADSQIKVWTLPISPAQSESSSPPPLGCSRPGSPRKRSHDEFEERVDVVMGGSGSSGSSPESALDQRTKDHIVRQGVIAEMFNSDWRMDALIEMSINDVPIPAALFVRNPETHKIEPYTGPKPGGSEPVPEIRVLVRKPWPGALINSLPPTKPSPVAMSYIVLHHDLRGKFDPKRAKELGVEPGPKFHKLTLGQSVLAMDGKTVTSDMVLGATRKGRGFAIIDLPTAEYVEELLNRPEWSVVELMSRLDAFIWILGPGVGSHPRICEFTQRMDKVRHVVSSKDYSPNYLAMTSAATATARLSSADGDRYSVPVHDNTTLPQSCYLDPDAESIKVTGEKTTSVFEPAKPGMIIDISPQFGLNMSSAKEPLEISAVLKELNVANVTNRSMQRTIQRRDQWIESEEFQEKLATLRQDLSCGNAEIITLGTGSSLPSKYRNVSATLLRIPGHGNYLFDCGENTLGQLQRTFSPSELKEVLRDLKVIWISHLHADHHLGTVSVIRAWRDVVYGGTSPPPPRSPTDPQPDLAQMLSEKRLFVVSAYHMITWLREYASVDNFGFDKVIPLEALSTTDDERNIICSFDYHHLDADYAPVVDPGKGHHPVKTRLSFTNPDCTLTPLLKSATGLSDLLTVPVSHCQGAKATSFVFPNGFKISYSGDCRPSVSFARIGQGSTVLIHEATFEDDMRGDAIAKRHCTVSEALGVAQAMQAKNVVLTHFSQRYQTLPDLGLGSNRPESRSGSRSRSASPSSSSSTKPTMSEHRTYDVEPDIPGSDDVDTTTTTTSTTTATSTDTTPTLSYDRRDLASYVANVPVVLSFDLMRLNVRDALVAEANLPVLMELFKLIQWEQEEKDQEALSAAEAAKQGGGGGEGKKKGKKEKGGGKGKWSKEKKGGDGNGNGKGGNKAAKWDGSPRRVWGSG